jgi:hypothetical protein
MIPRPSDLTPVTPQQPTNAPQELAARVGWRGDVGIFPTKPGLAYREYAAVIRSKSSWGDGLLAPHESHRHKTIVLPIDPAKAARAEVLVFGTGLIRGPHCWVNGTERALYAIADYTMGREEAYPTASFSVNRSYSFAEIPPALLKQGDNAIRVGRCHAFLQTMVLRLFEAQPSSLDLALAVEPAAGQYRLQVAGGDAGRLAEVQFFARHRGMDMEGSGRPVTWQGAINKDESRPEDYAVANHCGSVTAAPWSATWDAPFVPPGPLQFRCRVKTTDGLWIESPGGIVEVSHEGATIVCPRPAEGFSPWGFHECGANQDTSLRCEFRLVAEDYKAVAGREMRRAVLAVPLYGEVDIDMNGRHSRHQMRVSAPSPGFHIRHVELPAASLFSRMNQVHLKSSGESGCFHAPGPMLYMIFDR